ncbi:MAG: hypothetical protein BMS9Abin26_0585 [Gammaproteobacteria bacterium]|nr:MAG: hypothetical protein BMS9Abin26_0585 [Gammaproteobacteria bacterium]
MIVVMNLLLFVIVILSIYWPYLGCRFWQGHWRYVALAALAFPLVFIAGVVMNLLAEPPRYNIDIYELLFYSLGSIAIMGLGTFVRMRVRARRRAQNADDKKGP